MDPERFKTAMSRWASGVTVITTRDAAGRPAGFTASSFASLSLEPPLVLFCLGRDSTNFDTFRAAETFAVNILGAGQGALSNRFAAHGGDKFAGVAHREGPGGLPLLEGCLARLACRVVDVLPGGDHLIFVGAVESVEAEDGQPLVYFRGGYHTAEPLP